MTEIYLDVLDNARKKVFKRLVCLAERGTLAGGTALSLQIKGRYSFDFDIFFEKQVIKRAFNIVKQALDIQDVTFERSYHITFLTKEEVQVTLFRYEFLFLYPKIKTPFLSLFDKRDIAADKAYTIGRRPAWRDYVDLFFLLKDGHVSLEKMIADAKRKFGFLFAEKLFLEQLTYYKDIRNFKVKFIEKKYSPEEIQEFLKKEVKAYINKKLLNA